MVGLIDIETSHLTMFKVGKVDSIEIASINSEREVIAFITNQFPIAFNVLSRELVTLERPPSTLIDIKAVDSGSILLVGEDGVVYSAQC